MFKRKIKKLFYKNITRKNSLILLGDFHMIQDDKDRRTGNKDFCESQEEFMSLITELYLEDFWRRQNPNVRLYTHFHGRNITYSRIHRACTSTPLR